MAAEAEDESVKFLFLFFHASYLNNILYRNGYSKELFNFCRVLAGKSLFLDL